MSLRIFINESNVWRTWGKNAKPAYDINNLSMKDRRELANAIEGALSPENLACDGEASMAHIRKRGAMLRKAQAELGRC